MEVTVQKKVILESLNKFKVNIKEVDFIEFQGTETDIGEPRRVSFVNSISGREDIQNSGLSESYLSAVMAVWGDSHTVFDEITE